MTPVPGAVEAREQDRSFRPDVEGLRAIAVGLVVANHAGVPWVSGGFVGVDVFFVLSGFLITGLLLRERERSGRTSLLGFYARRVRRILPAGTLVAVVTVLASYHWLGFLRGNRIAGDGRWVALFAGNLHFAADGTKYLNANVPASPLQHYWSLAVEEQFYLLWPVLLATTAVLCRRSSLRITLAGVLSGMIVSSLAWSVVETSSNGTWAFFSPLTRAWELALGGLIAVAVPLLRSRDGRPRAAWASLSWVGLLVMLASAYTIGSGTAFPGWAVTAPVLGAAAVVTAGTAAPGSGAEMLLRLPPFQWVGRISYSLYLWHWPLLKIAEQRRGTPLPPAQSLLWVAVAVVLSVLTLRLVENPIRFARRLTSSTTATLLLGAVLIGATFGLCAWEIYRHTLHA